MKLTLVVTSLLAVCATSASSVGIEARQTVQTCGDPRQAAPWFRGYNPTIVNHFYTANRGEFQTAVGSGYRDEGVAAYIFTNNQPGTVALFRMYSPAGSNHFYTTSTAERNNAVNNLGYNNEGITGYIYPSNVCGGVALYRLYNSARVDHFYTTSTSERDSAARSGYANEGITGYVLPY